MRDGIQTLITVCVFFFIITMHLPAFRYRFAWKLLVFVLLARNVCGDFVFPEEDGVPNSLGYPTYHDREALMATNMCRVIPRTFQEEFLPSLPTILQPSNYPPTRPLHFHDLLSEAAHYHSRDLSDNNCYQSATNPPNPPQCFGHSSTDGTSFGDRVRRFFPNGKGFSENVAAILMDSPSAGHTMVVNLVNDNGAADRSSGDGHRRNIMNTGSKIIGNGDHYNGDQNFQSYLTQDFGSNDPETDSPIASGCHMLYTNEKTRFQVAIWTEESVLVTRSNVVIDGNSHELDYLGGSSGSQGMYEYVTNRGSTCRAYYFEFIVSNTTAFYGDGYYRYPTRGQYYTTHEGGCKKVYSSAASVSIGFVVAYMCLFISIIV